MTGLKRVVVIGGTGNFGRRICRRLVDESNVELIVTSRDPARAAAVTADLPALHESAQLHAEGLDQFSRDFRAKLRNLRPDIVVHTAGPYQGQDYRVAEACIDCESHYVDLADGRQFVEGFGDLDGAARRAGLFLVTGASTLPGVSSAVIDSLRDQFRQIEEVRITISPAHRTPRGPSTIAAVLSYCGRPFPVLVDGRSVTSYGWQDLRIRHHPALGRRFAGACDVPDLGLLPAYLPHVGTVMFHAALAAPWEQLVLWLMSWLTRARLVRAWGRFVPLFSRISDTLMDFGSETGGMEIELVGLGPDHNRKTVRWLLTAGRNHGPEIPCSPALILVRKFLRDEISVRGALACLGMITLDDFADEVGDLDISWDVLTQS